MAGDRAADVFDTRGLGGDGIVEGQWTIDDGMFDLATIGHFAQTGCIDGGSNGRLDDLHGR